MKLSAKSRRTMLKSILVAGGIGFLISLSSNVTAESSTTVDVTTNTGENTVCVNGECTTSNGKSESRVCVNGKCYESEGDLNVSSEDGSTKVDIKTENKTSVDTNNDTKIEVKSETDSEQKSEDKESGEKEASAKNDEEKEESAENSGEFSLVDYIKNKLSSIRRIITFQFLFGDK